ncbi:MAG: hypothetical protein KKB51_25000 [Candidatus Riflebacteria bacterium]|nr:hypothetical protein [Candidatus Riflebacteria bacterium]
MVNNSHFLKNLIILLIFICFVPIVAFSADSDRQLLKEWIEGERFLDSSIEDRLVLLEKCLLQNSGENIFVASIDSFKEEVNMNICEFTLNNRDLKEFMESLNFKRKLFFHVSEKVKIESDMIFKNCTLFSMVEGLCNKYQLKAFYYAREVYFIPHTKANID